VSQSAENLKTLPDTYRELESRIAGGEARVCVVGLGTAGLPFLAIVAAAGFPAVGVDVDENLVDAINRGEPPPTDADVELLGRLVEQRRLSATTDFSALAEQDCIVVSVPTSSSAAGEPELGAITAVAQEAALRLRRGQLIIIESTVPPGTTRGVVLPILEAGGLSVGSDFFLAFSPERIDPGNASFSVHDIPKVVGGVTDACTSVAARFYERVVAKVYPVSSPEVAETAKVFENTFRFVNISLANELSQVCGSLGISASEVLDAASTKPFAFMRHSPGPGVGGRCLTMASHYFRWAAGRHGADSKIVNAAIEVDALIPELLAKEALGSGGESALGGGPLVMLIGMAYKPGVSDYRGSTALAVASILRRAGAVVQYHDPLVPAVTIDGEELTSLPLTPEVVRKADCVVVLCPHRTIDYDAIRTYARRIVDPTNTIGGRPRG